MKEIKWTNDLSVGVEVIDEQHRMLIDHLNRLTAAVEEQHGPELVGKTLGFLIDYTWVHFSEEERLMEDALYPELSDHKMKHEEFKQTLADLERDFRDDGPTHMLAEAVDTLLINWLVKHIREVDTRVGVFLKGKQS